MTTYYATEITGITSQPVIKPSAVAAVGARLRRYRGTVVLNTQTTSDTIVVAVVPSGEDFAYGVITSDTSLGSSTIAIGNSSSTGKYRAAATFTATNTPTFFGNAAQVLAPASTAEEQIIITIATASLPASGNLVIDLFFTRP